MPHNYIASDQPVTCPVCGQRTDGEDEGDVQHHRCGNCGYTFDLTFDEEDEMSEVRQQIIRGMERAFFACGWADQYDNAYDEAKERGEEDAFLEKHGSLSGKDIMDVMPKELDPAAIRQAARVLADLERLNNTTVEAIYEEYPGPGTPELWGHYLAMEAMGQGVGLSTDYDVPESIIRLPFPAFYEAILDKEYF